MKITTTLKTVLSAIAAILLLGCRPGLEVPEAGSGMFRFWTTAVEPLAAEPLAAAWDPLLDRIEVEGHGPRGAQFLIAARGAQCGVPDLQAGRWQINARALNCQEKTAATGQVEVDIGAEDAGAFDIYFSGENALPTVDLTVGWSRLSELEAGLAGEIELCTAPLADPRGAVTVLGPAPFYTEGALGETAAASGPTEASVAGVQLPIPEDGAGGSSAGAQAGLGRTYILTARLRGSCLEDGLPVAAGGAWLLRTVPRLQLAADIAFAPAELTARILPAGLADHTVLAAADDSLSPLVLRSPAPPLFAGRQLAFSSGSTPALWYLDGEPAGSGTELQAAPGAGPHRLSLLQARDLGPLTGCIQQELQLLTPVRVGPMVLRRIFARGDRYPPNALLPAEPIGMDGLRGLSGSPDGRYLAAAGYSSDTLLIFRQPSDYTTNAGLSAEAAGAPGVPEAAAGALLPAALASHSAAAPLDGVSDTAFAPFSSEGGVYRLATASKNSSSLVLWQLTAEAGGGPAELQSLGIHSLQSSPALEGAAALAFSPDGRHLYCAGQDSGIISVWSAPSTEATEAGQALSLVAEVPPPPGCEGPADIAVSSGGRWAAAAFKGSDSLCIFRRSPSDGGLTVHRIFTDESDGVDQLNGVHRVDFAASDPEGLHLYSSSYYDDAVCLFSLTGTDDSAVWSYSGSWKEFGSVQEPIQAFSTGPAAEYQADIGRLNYTQGLAVSPSGDLLALAAGSNDALCLWSRNPVDGSLSPLAALREGLESSPTESSGGLPLPLPGFSGPLSGLDGARSVLWSPGGRRLYCAASNSNALTILEQW